MAQWQPVTNLKAKLIQHPPVVVFFLCLLLLAGAFITFGLYSQNHEIKNPDISLDWNQMLGSLASLKFCTHLNSTEILSGKQDDSPPLLDHADSPVTNTSQRNMGVVSMSLLVPLAQKGDEPNQNCFSAALLGSQLGLKGSAGKEFVNISLFLHLPTPLSKPKSNSALDLQLSPTAETKSKSSFSCLQITAQAHHLPQTLKPPECPANVNVDKNMSPIRAFGIESYKQSSQNTPPCLSLEFTPDPKLTLLLTQEEKALARNHLMLASIVLLAICSMTCITATLTCSRSRRHLAKNLHFQKESLLGS